MKTGSSWADACSSAKTCCWQSGRQRVFGEGEAEPVFDPNVALYWTCTSHCKPTPALRTQGEWLAGALFSLALISCLLNHAELQPVPSLCLRKTFFLCCWRRYVQYTSCALPIAWRYKSHLGAGQLRPMGTQVQFFFSDLQPNLCGSQVFI